MLGGIDIFLFRNTKKPQYDEQKENIEKYPIPSSISDCEKLAQDIFGKSSDILIQTFPTYKNSVLIIFVDGLVNKDLIYRDLINPLKSPDFTGDLSLAIKTLYEETEDMSVVVEKVLTGNVAVFYEKSRKAYIVELRDWEKRPVSQPDAEAVIRGPKESFTECIRTNTALIRRKIKTPKFNVESMTLGRQTKTSVSLIYINGIVNQDVLSELKKRLEKIDMGEILETGQIEQQICQNTFLPFSGMGLTQKPDLAAQHILNGKVIILCDGT
ncbi:MAG: spore germination protein, partial [Bacilli bacterium]|nr:spore germination protein [Bacilli bacterium]